MGKGSPFSKKALRRSGKAFVRSIWLFPAILTLLLLGLTAFGINGSSIGVYNQTFYGDKADPDLLAGHPRNIRSDEWLVNTQLTIAQGSDNYHRTNENIGNGQDVSLLSDAPYKEWSAVFKPHNLAFFVLPFDNAFAFKWWFPGFLLALSCYFFTLCLLPRQRMLAALLSTALFFSPFVQWLYLYGTIGSLAYCLFGATIFMKLLHETRRRMELVWGLLLAYVTTCFALLLYPPFQIPVAIATAVFAIGYLLEQKSSLTRKMLLQKLGYVFGALMIAGVIALTFLHTRSAVVESIQNTAYPGKRSVTVGGDFDFQHYFSSHLARQFLNDEQAAHYRVKNLAPSHQSEASNFILLAPFLILPATILVIYGYKKRQEIDWPLLLTTAMFVVFLAWLFSTGASKILNWITLGQVPTYRVLIGTGLLGIMQLVLVIRNLGKLPRTIFRPKEAGIYATVIYAFLIFLGYHALIRSPGFISEYKVWLLAIPIPIIIYLLLRRRFILALAGFALFSIYSAAPVNPLYQGTGVLRDNEVSRTIKALNAASPGRWVITDDLALENMASLNGVGSISGVFAYPQPKLWQDIDPKNDENIYNRYAHVIFTLDRNPSVDQPTKLTLMQTDYFQVNTEPCSDFLKEKGVHYVLTTVCLLYTSDAADE